MSGTNGTIISMRDIRKTYDTGKIKVEALKGIDLLVAPGEFVATVGPSGSGKSTLMNLIGCLDTPSAGRYRLSGEDVSAFDRDALADVRNRRVGFGGVWHLNKGKTPRAAGVAVHDDLDAFDLSIGMKKLSEFFSHGSRHNRARVDTS